MSTQAMKWAFDVLSSSNLGPIERCVLTFLGFRHHHKTGDCFPSMETIGIHAGVSERRARTAIRRLEAAGLCEPACKIADNVKNLSHFQL